MGMFDTVRSSYDLGPGFQKDLQTKDLDCCMNEYWIDPSGRLFEIDFSGTHDFLEIVEDHRGWPKFQTIPNGNHGKVKPVYLFKVIEVYPSEWDCKYSPYIRKHIFFKDGIIEEVK
jgi:hypothetical protein